MSGMRRTGTLPSEWQIFMPNCIFCNICVDDLEEVGEGHAVFWMNLCAKFVGEDFRALPFKNEYGLVKQLEKNHVLQTHEDNRAIWLIPEGYLDSDPHIEEHYFCLNPEVHYGENM